MWCELAENQHYSHFHNGPYGKRCYGGGIDKKGRVGTVVSKCKGPIVKMHGCCTRIN